MHDNDMALNFWFHVSAFGAIMGGVTLYALLTVTNMPADKIEFVSIACAIGNVIALGGFVGMAKALIRAN